MLSTPLVEDELHVFSKYPSNKLSTTLVVDELHVFSKYPSYKLSTPLVEDELHVFSNGQIVRQYKSNTLSSPGWYETFYGRSRSQTVQLYIPFPYIQQSCPDQNWWIALRISMILGMIVADHLRVCLDIYGKSRSQTWNSTAYTVTKYTAYHVQLITFECLEGYYRYLTTTRGWKVKVTEISFQLSKQTLISGEMISG